MPLEIQSATLNAGGTQTFTFSSNVLQYVAGISECYLSYGPGVDHHVQEVAVSLNVGHPSNQVVSVQANLTLSDGGGHHIDPDGSSVVVVVVAWTSVASQYLTLASAASIPNDQHSDGIGIGSSTPAILDSALAGFDLAYSSGHHIKEIGASMQATHVGTTASLYATAEMKDSSGNTASKASADGMLIAYGGQSPAGFEVQTTGALEDFSKLFPRSQTLTFGTGVTRAAVLIKSFKAVFTGKDDDHMIVLWVYARGPEGQKNGNYVVDSNHKLTVIASANMGGPHLHGQDPDSSWVVALIIGY